MLASATLNCRLTPDRVTKPIRTCGTQVLRADDRGRCFRPGRIVDEEQFGPALPIVEYTDIDDAVRRANSGMFGLGGSVWSADTEQAATVARRLEKGLSWVNTHTV